MKNKKTFLIKPRQNLAKIYQNDFIKTYLFWATQDKSC